MPLTEVDKVQVRRFLDYSAIGLYRQSNGGGSLAPFNTGFRMFNSYGNLEFKMNNLLPEEEATLTGRPYGAIAFNQPNPTQYTIPVDSGSTVQVSIASTAFGSSSPVVLNYTVLEGDTFLTICGNIAQLAASNGVFSGAGFYAMNGYGAGPIGQPQDPSQQVTMPICSFVAPTPCTPFTLTVTGTGQTIPQIIANGSPLPPSLTSNLTFPATKVFGYLPILVYLEDQMLGSTSDNLSVFKANDAILRLTEMKDRKMLFKTQCNRLAVFLGIMKNPDNAALTGSATLGNLSGGTRSVV